MGKTVSGRIAIRGQGASWKLVESYTKNPSDDILLWSFVDSSAPKWAVRNGRNERQNGHRDGSGSSEKGLIRS